MKLKWLGHSCFLLTSNNGVRVVTDPFNEKVGYRLPEIEAEIVTTSHGHYDHYYTDAVKGNFVHLKEPGFYKENGIEITGTDTFHDDVNGAKRGKNVIFKFSIDEIRICHCGDLGHLLNEAQLREIGETDVLLIPVGGVYTLDSVEAVKVIKQIKPAITIPMHFKTAALSFQLDSIERFIDSAGEGSRINRQEIEINKDNIHEFPNIAILNYE